MVELLAVIVIITMITLMVVPNILNSVSNKQNEVSETAKQMIYDAADIYVKQNSRFYPKNSGSNYCLKLETLVNDGQLVEPVKDIKTNKEIPLNYYISITVDNYNQYEYELKKECN